MLATRHSNRIDADISPLIGVWQAPFTAEAAS